MTPDFQTQAREFLERQGIVCEARADCPDVEIVCSCKRDIAALAALLAEVAGAARRGGIEAAWQKLHPRLWASSRWRGGQDIEALLAEAAPAPLVRGHQPSEAGDRRSPLPTTGSGIRPPPARS